MSPPSVRPHRAEHAMSRGFGPSIPGFLRVDVTTDWNPPEPKASKQDELPKKLLPGAKRWVVKFGRRARVRLQNAK